MKQLRGAPWLLAHRSMLKSDRPMKISLLGNDYVLWQDRHGTVNALPNAALSAHGRNVVGRVVCVSN